MYLLRCGGPATVVLIFATDLLGVLDPLETILQLHTSSGGGDAAHSQHSTLSLLTGHTTALLDGRLPTAHVTGAAA